MLSLPNYKGGLENPSAPIGFNAFCATNFWSRLAMRGAEFHWNTRREANVHPQFMHMYIYLYVFIYIYIYFIYIYIYIYIYLYVYMYRKVIC